MGQVFIVKTKDIEEGKTKPVTIDGRRLLVCHSKGEFYAIDNECSHAMARLTGGKLRGCRIFCPLHGASFDLRDGKALGLPATLPIRVYPISVEGGAIYASLPDNDKNSQD